jgi:hypothetical protein
MERVTGDLMFRNHEFGTLPIAGSLLILLALISPSAVSAQSLSGNIGSSPQWGSGWLDLASPMNFAKGDRLKLTIGGTANKIIVRLLPAAADASASVGVVGGPITVPASRIVEIVLPEDRKQVIQISVHAGPNPWGEYPLGGGNGPATIKAAERLKP